MNDRLSYWPDGRPLSAGLEQRSGSLYNLRTSFGTPLAVLAALAFVFANPAKAQPRLGAVSGTVKDSLGKPIENVEVTATKAAKSVRTDSAGEFLIAGLEPGAMSLSVRRLSYAPVTLTVQIPPADTTDVEITLSVVAQRLTGVIVQADANHTRELVDFELRRTRGIGHFITRAQIEQRNPLLLSDMVRTIPGATLLANGNGQVVLHFARAPHNDCPPQFYIDGMPVAGFSIDDIAPIDVEGVELYAGVAGLPPQFNRLHGNTICGTVVIWTRIPGNDKPDKKKP